MEPLLVQFWRFFWCRFPSCFLEGFRMTFPRFPLPSTLRFHWNLQAKLRFFIVAGSALNARKRLRKMMKKASIFDSKREPERHEKKMHSTTTPGTTKTGVTSVGSREVAFGGGHYAYTFTATSQTQYHTTATRNRHRRPETMKHTIRGLSHAWWPLNGPADFF